MINCPDITDVSQTGHITSENGFIQAAIKLDFDLDLEDRKASIGA